MHVGVEGELVEPLLDEQAATTKTPSRSRRPGRAVRLVTASARPRRRCHRHRAAAAGGRGRSGALQRASARAATQLEAERLEQTRRAEPSVLEQRRETSRACTASPATRPAARGRAAAAAARRGSRRVQHPRHEVPLVVGRDHERAARRGAHARARPRGRRAVERRARSPACRARGRTLRRRTGSDSRFDCRSSAADSLPRRLEDPFRDVDARLPRRQLAGERREVAPVAAAARRGTPRTGSRARTSSQIRANLRSSRGSGSGAGSAYCCAARSS